MNYIDPPPEKKKNVDYSQTQKGWQAAFWSHIMVCEPQG